MTLSFARLPVRRKPLLMALVLGLCLIFAFGAQAQDLLTSIYVTNDGYFRLEYPTTWNLTELDDGSVLVTRGDMAIFILPPAALIMLGDEVTGAETTSEFLDAFTSATEGMFELGTAEEIELLSGKKVLEAPIEDSALTSETVIAVPVEDTFAVLIVSTSGDASTTAAVTVAALMIADSFELRSGSPLVTAPDDALLDVNALIGSGMSGDDWEGAVAELRRLDLIPAEGGEAVYGEDTMIWGIQPGLNLDPDSTSDYTDFAMGAVISLRLLEEDDTAICGLLTRVTGATDGSLTTYLVVGITEINTVVVLERFAQNADPFVYETDVVDADFYSPQHLLYIVQGNSLSAYVNGKPVIEALELTTAPEAIPANGIIGTALDRDCVMTGIWAYGLPSGEAGAADE